LAHIYFISGRSGSTLLPASLRQNPRFYASMSRPLAGRIGPSMFIDDVQRQRVLRGLFDKGLFGQADSGTFLPTHVSLWMP
jgi:sulfotransferase